jgi:hypothetical protein
MRQTSEVLKTSEVFGLYWRAKTLKEPKLRGFENL